ncbi:MAG: flagellar basal body L-ring protein FlgH [Planctomycetaceae bacterium]|nr:flagellar basal body L-ring protein FlgH [Planctomycetaceae bacterium]
MKIRVALLMVAALLGAACPCGADSIYARATRRGVSTVTTDDTARKVGDSLTVQIAEISEVSNTTNNTMEKTTSRAAKMSGTVKLGNMLGAWAEKIFGLKDIEDKTYVAPTVDLSASSGNKFDGKSDYGSNRSIADSITVTVYDVHPNGNLVIMGTRKRQVGGNVQYVQISGIVRLSDITYANTISSAKIAEFQFVTYDRGQSDTFVRPGWLDAILNVISPS